MADQYDYDTAIKRRWDTIDNMGIAQTTWTRQQAQRQAASLAQQRSMDIAQAQLASQNVSNQNNSTMQNSGDAGTNFGSFQNAIAQQESGGNYGAVNKSSGALGKYQVMPSNLAGAGRGWDYEALGYDVTPQQYLQSSQIQDAVAGKKLSTYYQQYGPAGAAIAWYAGPSAADKYVNSGHASTGGQGAYPSVNSYYQQILKKMGLG